MCALWRSLDRDISAQHLGGAERLLYYSGCRYQTDPAELIQFK